MRVALAVAVLLLGVLPGPAGAYHDAPVLVQPGALLRTGGGSCTAGFLFEAPDGTRYLSTAGHCVRAVGEEAYVVNAQGQRVEPIGKVAYRHYAFTPTLIILGHGHPLDFALIQLDPDVTASPVPRGHSTAPTAVRDCATLSTGDLVTWTGNPGGVNGQQWAGDPYPEMIDELNVDLSHLPPWSGQGPVTSATRERVYFAGVVAPGHSGSPLLHGSDALGIIVTIGASASVDAANQTVAARSGGIAVCLSYALPAVQTALGITLALARE